MLTKDQKNSAGFILGIALSAGLRLAIVPVLGFLLAFPAFFFLWMASSFTFATSAAYYAGCTLVALALIGAVLYESTQPDGMTMQRAALLAPVFLAAAVILGFLTVHKGNSAVYAKNAKEAAKKAATAERLANRTPEEKFWGRCYSEGRTAVWTDRPVSEACQGTSAAREGAASEIRKSLYMR
ncbi:hypothetical protein HG264_14355 [Pseudomonas sp. gcc21]|uniref:hypothetical protein n=1 Tax=Pseudomonas sp. gcc21 TaxID=2726989 RepID=UPI001451824E|nr:hypothetical protein [Pseudomonas sp. gcc21]QJD59993.1 hypothetical protein HG264_14355 [Pseudomonas sp. gcc21]